MLRAMYDYGRIRARKALGTFVEDQHGLEMIEIVLIATLVVIAAIVIWRNFGQVLVGQVQKMCTEISGDASKCGTN